MEKVLRVPAVGPEEGAPGCPIWTTVFLMSFSPPPALDALVGGGQ